MLCLCSLLYWQSLWTFDCCWISNLILITSLFLFAIVFTSFFIFFYILLYILVFQFFMVTTVAVISTITLIVVREIESVRCGVTILVDIETACDFLSLCHLEFDPLNQVLKFILENKKQILTYPSMIQSVPSQNLCIPARSFTKHRPSCPIWQMSSEHSLISIISCSSI